MIAQYHSVERELNKIFSENIIESPFSESGKNILEIDEAALFDSYVLGDMDVDPNKTSIEILEKGADVSFFGIEIPRKSHGKIMQDRSLAAIDGSSTIVNRSFISMVVAKAGMGSYGRGTKIPLSEAISEDFKILLSTDQVVKKEHEKIEKLPSRNPRSDALRMTATALQAKLEIQGIKYLIEEYPEIDILGIDGPLYFRNNISEATKNVKLAIDEGKVIFSIVKSSCEDRR